IDQVANAPGWYRYALSVWARADQAERLGLVRATNSSTHLVMYDVGTSWQRLALSGAFSGTEESLRFGLEVEAGRSVTVFGVQVEAQAGASGYRKTTSRCGVYPQARFDDDELSLTAEAPGARSGEVRIVTRT
ncbi:MAG: hypothetical protein ACRD96_21365, partial [Bryobacteraceae bacterium]